MIDWTGHEALRVAIGAYFDTEAQEKPVLDEKLNQINELQQKLASSEALLASLNEQLIEAVQRLTAVDDRVKAIEDEKPEEPPVEPAP